jgi:HEAT repeat protein
MLRESRRSMSKFLFGAFVLSGCADASDRSDFVERSGVLESSSEQASERAPDPAVDGDWRVRSARDAQTIRRDNPELAQLVAELEPSPTRAGFARFTTPVIHDPAVASLLLVRLAEGGDPPDVRAALVEALPRTGGDFADAVLDLLTEEQDAQVRVALVSSLRRAPASHAVPGLELALADRDPAIRALAAQTAAMHEQGHALADPLRAALSDEHGPTRAAAARAMGVFGITAAQGQLAGLVDDDVPEVRLEALRALTRVDPAGATRLPQLERLQRDGDPRVARLARTIVAD